MKKENLRVRLPLIVAAFVFFAFSVEAFSHGNIGWGIFNLFAAMVNTVILKYLYRQPELINVFVNILNAVVAFVTAYNSYSGGKTLYPVRVVYSRFCRLNGCVSVFEKGTKKILWQYLIQYFLHL